MKIPGDNLLGSPGGGRQPEREQGVQLMPVLCGDQIRTLERCRNLSSHFSYFWEARAKDQPISLSASFPQGSERSKRKSHRGQQWIRQLRESQM